MQQQVAVRVDDLIAHLQERAGVAGVLVRRVAVHAADAGEERFTLHDLRVLQIAARHHGNVTHVSDEQVEVVVRQLGLGRVRCQAVGLHRAALVLREDAAGDAQIEVRGFGDLVADAGLGCLPAEATDVRLAVFRIENHVRDAGDAVLVAVGRIGVREEVRFRNRLEQAHTDERARETNRIRSRIARRHARERDRGLAQGVRRAVLERAADGRVREAGVAFTSTRGGLGLQLAAVVRIAIRRAVLVLTGAVQANDHGVEGSACSRRHAAVVVRMAAFARHLVVVRAEHLGVHRSLCVGDAVALLDVLTGAEVRVEQAATLHEVLRVLLQDVRRHLRVVQVVALADVGHRRRTTGPTRFVRPRTIRQDARSDVLRVGAGRTATVAVLAFLTGRNAHGAVLVVRSEAALTDDVAERVRVVIGLGVTSIVEGRAVQRAAVRDRHDVAHVLGVRGRAHRSAGVVTGEEGAELDLQLIAGHDVAAFASVARERVRVVLGVAGRTVGIRGTTKGQHVVRGATGVVAEGVAVGVTVQLPSAEVDVRAAFLLRVRLLAVIVIAAQIQRHADGLATRGDAVVELVAERAALEVVVVIDGERVFHLVTEAHATGATEDDVAVRILLHDRRERRRAVGEERRVADREIAAGADRSDRVFTHRLTGGRTARRASLEVGIDLLDVVGRHLRFREGRHDRFAGAHGREEGIFRLLRGEQVRNRGIRGRAVGVVTRATGTEEAGRQLGSVVRDRHARLIGAGVRACVGERRAAAVTGGASAGGAHAAVRVAGRAAIRVAVGARSAAPGAAVRVTVVPGPGRGRRAATRQV